MTNQIEISLLNQPDVLKILAMKKSSFYKRLEEGLLPPNIPTGERNVGWIKHEIQSVLVAMCAGKSPEEIKELVTELVAKRSELI